MNRSSTRDLALVAVFAAVIAALGLAPPLYLFGGSVPVTAQTLGVMLAGSVLGARRGALAVVTFLVLTAVGLPLLSGGRGGPAVFVGPSVGFLLGWVLGAFVVGWVVERRLPGRVVPAQVAAANALGGIGAVYLLGIPGMVLVGGLTWSKAFAASLVFLPGDGVKVAVATVVTLAVLRGYPGVVPSRRAAVGAGTEASR
ncbi:MAG: biotin transporter BioY [Actinobacteria bacterium]|nr:biotin transporter BioY [Actinomycetota bacterium]